MEWVPRAGPSNRINAPRGCQNVTAHTPASRLTPPAARLPETRAAALRGSRSRHPTLPRDGGDGARLRHGARGRARDPSRDRRARLPPAAGRGARLHARAARGRDPLHRQPRPARAARGDRAGARASRGRARGSGARARHERHLAGDAARVLAARRAGRRGDPRHAALSLLSELRAHLRRNSRADSDRGRGRLSDRRRGGAARARAAHARDRRELARESDRRDPERRDAGRARGARGSARLGRDLRRARLRRRAHLLCALARNATSSCSTASRSATR